MNCSNFLAPLSSYEQTQAFGAKATATMNITASESRGKICGALPKNQEIASDDSSKIATAVKDGQNAVDSAVAASKEAYVAAGADQSAINAASAEALAAIDAALSAAMTAINTATTLPSHQFKIIELE
ncbi:hypothetical protein DdX_17955 [Ditylenchus destructor]|uniref:Uncharacterized protein n=1 Tax=Ditylenchus destructor TaxID=166010 RepID=A0AAD4MQF9_9BILA|nr:hypothetical protein DdX_17955 [Ditylenchus destructor]